MRPAAALQEALWPRHVICLCCGWPSYGGHLCSSCRNNLADLRMKGPLCEICGHPLKDGRCAFRHLTGAATLHSVWTYRDMARDLVRALKFNAIADAAQVMAEGMADLARKQRFAPSTVVTWPTMPAHRRLERGIDHGERLASAVGERLGLPARQLLTRSETIAAGTQVGQSRAERLTRLQGAFSCELALRCPVLLIDDVLTTSATATACAECLLGAGAASVTVITATVSLAINPQSMKKEV